MLVWQRFATVYAEVQLRSSPTPEGRCWTAAWTVLPSGLNVLRSSPTPEGRCWRS